MVAVVAVTVTAAVADCAVAAEGVLVYEVVRIGREDLSVDTRVGREGRVGRMDRIESVYPLGPLWLKREEGAPRNSGRMVHACGMSTLATLATWGDVVVMSKPSEGIEQWLVGRNPVSIGPE